MNATKLVDLIAGHPAVYSRIQDLAGRETIMRHMQPWLDRLSGRVLDVGGGTGRISQGLGHSIRYLCVDLERPKLLALKRTFTHATGLLADAAALPFGSNTFDAALLIGVTHHLSREALPAVVAEIARVLRPSRQLIMLDALWAPKRLVGRALWACDRGRHPRTAADLQATFRAVFDIEDETMFTVLHEYYGVRCRKRASAT
jgi:ubiquinone/menaquinone biosynthesis C-methylase UbiE